MISIYSSLIPTDQLIKNYTTYIPIYFHIIPTIVIPYIPICIMISTVDSILLYKVYERIAGSGRDTDILQATRDGTVFAAPLR